MGRRVRTILWTVGLIVVALLVTGGFVLGPRMGAVRCLTTFGWPVPDDLGRIEDAPDGFTVLADEATYGVPYAFVRRTPDGKVHPTLVFIHGVARVGLRDGRILRAIEAFHRAGFTVIAPEIGPLLDPTRPSDEVDGLDRLLDALAAGRIEGASTSRFGLVGISVGGALALRAGARFQERGGRGLRGILAIGAPDDLRTPARDWFVLPDPAPEGGDSLEWRRNNAAAFARNFVLRAALEKRVGNHPDFTRLRDWLAEEALPAAAAPELETEAGQALARIVHAPAAERAKERDALLADAWHQLIVLSPADWSAQLTHLRGIAVFLLHGYGDPLVPIAEADLLAARLERHTLVSVLRSRVLGHTAVNGAGLREQLAHVVFLDDFFDMVGG